jgi:hypothetical protein
MKRLSLAFALAALAFSMTVLSCDGMFQTNLFSKATHETLTASSVAEKTPDQLQELVQSDAYLQQLADPANSAIKDAALGALATSYGTLPTYDPLLPNADATGQLAAVVAVDILIKTDADAAAFSAGVVGAFEGLASLSNADATPADLASSVANTVVGVLPFGISTLVAPGAPMPDSFASMLDTFFAAQEVFNLLGNNLGTVQKLDANGDPVYDPDTGLPVMVSVYAADVPPSEALSLAVNAVIATMVTSIQVVADPSNPGLTAAEAIWRALCDPVNAGTYISFSSTALGDAAYLGNLLSAANFSL